jgi:hypothetical protein
MLGKRLMSVLLAAMSFYLFFPPFAYAYLDPGE